MSKNEDEQYQDLKQRFSDKWWRLNNLYYIKDAEGKKIKFKPNWAQEDLYNNTACINVILKARQLGFTTFIMIDALDDCLFNKFFSAGVIAHTREDAEDLFDNKIKFAYDNLPKYLKAECKAEQDNKRQLKFKNGSSIRVGTSLRSGTYQKLLVSEFGKIAAKYPEKAKEIKTGALNTVHAGQHIFIESTAEGNSGDFYDLCEEAKKIQQQGKEITVLDPKFHFYPWFKNPNYTLDAEVTISAELQDYFARLPVELTDGQKAWYVKKSIQQGEDMKREFPSTPEESFEQSMEGAIFAKEMKLVRQNGQVTHVPHNPRKAVYTFWDLGKGSDYTSIWFFQKIGNKHHFIDYHESHNEGWDFYAKLLNSKPYTYKEHVLPHDANTKTVGKKMSTSKKDLLELGVRPIRVVPKTSDLWSDIKGACKQTLPMCWFDESKCAIGIKHLDNYRREWDRANGQWKDTPKHDDASHGADAYRTFAVGFVEKADIKKVSMKLGTGAGGSYMGN